jgi:hypothetical protein
VGPTGSRMPTKSPAKVAKKVVSQRTRFIKAAREHGVSEDEAVFDENLRRIATVKASGPEPKGQRKPRRRLRS